VARVELLPAGPRVARPWRNGGGVTHDILVLPEGAGDDEFLWRASLATVAAAGPFSAWPGVDRALMVLAGELIVAVDGEAERRLGPDDPAIGFAGEAAVAARPAGDACTVLNIMARRDRVQARVNRWHAARRTAADQALLVAEAPVSISVDGRSLDLGTHDALLLDRLAVATLQIGRPLIVAELFATA
jgi:environmental stress-induced protein Ves